MSSYAHVVNTPAKQVISRNENAFKMSKDDNCTCKACKNTVFHCQICKFVGFLLPSSSCLLKLPDNCVVEGVHAWMDDHARTRFPRTPSAGRSGHRLRHSIEPDTRVLLQLPRFRIIVIDNNTPCVIHTGQKIRHPRLSCFSKFVCQLAIASFIEEMFSV